MAETSVSDFMSLINQQVNSREELNICLSKAEALISVALSSDLTELPEVIIHEYLWTLSDLIEQAVKLNGNEIGFLLRFSRTKFD